MDDTKTWYAVYVKSRNEKKVADRLQERGVEVFCPMQKTLRQWSDRKKMVEIPVLPSYVFVHINMNEERMLVFDDPGTVRFVHWLGKPAIIRADEIKAIKTLLNADGEANTEAYRNYRKGDLVTISEGPFSGNEALLLDIKRNKAVLRLQSIQLQLSIEVHPQVLSKSSN